MALLKVYNGASWDSPIAKVYDGSAWVGSKKFYDGTAWVSLAAGLLVIVAATKSISNIRIQANCATKVKVDSDGSLYASNNLGVFGSAYEVWLDAGLNSQVWVERTIISGSLNNGDPGAGRLACTADRIYGILRSTSGTSTAVIDLKFYDAASGGNLLDTQRVTLIAERDDLE